MRLIKGVLHKEILTTGSVSFSLGDIITKRELCIAAGLDKDMLCLRVENPEQ